MSRWIVAAVAALGACAGDAPDLCPGVPAARTIAEEAADPLVSDLAVDADSVFWVNFRGGEVRRASKGGGSGETTAQTGAPQRIAIDEQNVYWVTGFAGVATVSKTGGAVTVISPDIECTIEYPCGGAIATDADAVYWAADAHLKSWSKQGGAPVEILAPEIYTGDIVVDSANVYWGALVLTDRLSFELRASPKAGGDALTIGALAEETYWVPYAMEGDADSIYVARPDGVWRFPKTGSGAVQIAPGPILPRSIATDGVNVYVSEGDRILRAPTSGGELVPIACEQMLARHLKVDATDLYWNAEAGNAILSTPK